MVMCITVHIFLPVMWINSTERLRFPLRHSTLMGRFMINARRLSSRQFTAKRAWLRLAGNPNASFFRISGTNNCERHVRNSRKSKHARTRRRQINYATTHKWTSIVYTDHSLMTVLSISYFDHRSPKPNNFHQMCSFLQMCLSRSVRYKIAACAAANRGSAVAHRN